MAKILETERLTLREMSAADAPFIVELLNEPAFILNIGDRGVRSLDDARRYLETGPIASYGRHGFGLYLVEDKDKRIPLGMCGLLQRETLPDVDIGYAFLPAYWSQGYALEAAAAVLTWGLQHLKLRRILAIVAPGNDRSIRLLGKLGMGFERTITAPDGGSELMLFSTGP